ncbi:MAG: hypothetical protein ACPG8W_07620, partial [Candidatus Promineifilaceae bacterium]
PQLPLFLGTIKSGFDLATRHWWLGILPFMIDMLLWLGPRLNYQKLGRAYIDFWLSQMDSAEFSQPIPLEQFYSILEQSNLFSALSAPFFGVPTLLSGIAQTDTPIATGMILLDSWRSFGVNWLLIGMTSMLLSTIYFSLIAQVVQKEQVDWAYFGRNLLPNTVRLTVLTIIVFIALIALLFLLTLVATIAGLLNQILTFVVLIGGAVVVMWGIIRFSFSSQALFLQNLSPLRAVGASMQIVKHQFIQVFPLLFFVVLIRNVTDSLWLLAYDGSWLVLVSLAGHAFIATALVAAMFIIFHKLTMMQDRKPVLAK